MTSKKSIPRTHMLGMALVTGLSILLFGALWFAQSQAQFAREATALRADLTQDKEALISGRVEDAVSYIEFKNRQTGPRLRSLLQAEAAELLDTANRLYELGSKNIAAGSVERMVRAGLQSPRVPSGCGIFVLTSGGTPLVHTWNSGRNEQKPPDLESGPGLALAKTLAQLASAEEQGFYEWTWPRENTDGRVLTRVRLFKPYNWIIGVSGYYSDMENVLKREALARLSEIRFERDHYLFAGKWDGLSLLGPAAGTMMFDSEDADARNAVGMLIELAKNGGGFARYVMPEIDGQHSGDKLSYVQGVPAWEWYVGTGVYTDDIEHAVAGARKRLSEQIEWAALRMALILFGLMGAVYVLAKRTARKTEAAFDAFGAFFDRAATESVEMSADGLQYAEFERMAASVNRMVRARREAESALANSERQYRELVDSVNCVILRMDTEGRITYMNGFGLRFFGFEPEELVGQHVLGSIVPLTDTSGLNLEKVVTEAVSRPEDFSHYENENMRKDGTRVWVAWSNRAIYLETGEIAEILCVGADITARRQDEQERLRLSAAVEQSADAVAIADAAGLLSYVNPAFERITGYTRSGVIGVRSLWELCGDGGAAQRVLRQGRSWSGRHRAERNGGETYEAESSIAPVKDAAGSLIAYVAVHRDVTEQLRLEEQLQQSHKLEAIGQLAGGIAHDFNNLLQAIQGYMEMALEQIPGESPARADLREASRAAGRAGELVRQLLAFGRRETVMPQYIDLNDVAFGILEMLRRLLGEHIELHVLPAQGLKTVHADPGQLEQVLINLCVNARDAMPEGGTITIRTKNARLENTESLPGLDCPPGDYVLLEVQDTGAGIPESMAEHIFEPFFTTKGVGEGTGLGLATVHGIVKQHQGFVTFQSEAGTTFQVLLPAKEEAVVQREAIDSQAAAGGTETILFAEDEEMVRTLGVHVLRKAGYEVLAARDGEEAVALFNAQQHAIDMAILDVVMPKLSGRGVYDAIRAHSPEMPVLFSSGYSFSVLSEDGQAEGDFDIIQKPYPPNTLLRRVRELLDRRRA